MVMTWFFLILSILLTGIIVWQTLNNNMMQRESILWLLGCLVMIVMSICPKIVDSIAAFVGIDYPPSLVFLLGILFLLLLVFRLFLQTASLGHNVNVLARKVALLEEQLNEEEQSQRKVG